MFGQQGVGHPSSLKKLDNLGATPTCIEYVKNEELVGALCPCISQLFFVYYNLRISKTSAMITLNFKILLMF